MAAAIAPAAVFAADSPPRDEVVHLSGTGSDDAVDWEFFCTDGRRSGKWTTIPVPSNWELQGFGSYNYGHDRPKADEQGKYRHRFSVPPAWRDRQVRIVFEGSMTDTEVRVNGRPAGPVHQGGFYQFSHDITGLLDFDGENLLEVTVSKVSSNESVERAERLADFWVFGGIYRPVSLVARPLRHIDWTAIDARADGAFMARVHLGGPPGADAVSIDLLDAGGKPVAAASRVALQGGQQVVEIRTRAAAARAWSHEFPHLHHARIRLLRGTDVLHETVERFGFRTIEMRPGDGFYLNGRKIRFKGVNRHCFWPDTGRALNRTISENDARLIKEMNMNAVRMAHYPPDKHFLDACDELGLLVINELTGWHDAYDTPTGRRLVESMIRRDVNHPSIVIWANGNEGGHNFKLVDDYPRLDPQQRQVIHPTPSWERSTVFRGVDTAHYPTYADHVKRLAGRHVYMPTEFLHALYDGGAGAGLADFWDAITGSQVGAGGFIWALTDEGVVRTDRGGRIDTDGNHAPDGIVGPYREKSGSFAAIREIWSPVRLDPTTPGTDFDGMIPVHNDFQFTNLSECRFEWQWCDFPGVGTPTDEELMMVTRGWSAGPDVPPGQSSVLRIEVPPDFNARDVLRVTAIDPHGRVLFTWSRALRGPRAYREARFVTGSGNVLASEEADVLSLAAGPLTARFDLANGHLLDLRQAGRVAALRNGPRFVPAVSTARVAHRTIDGGHVVEARHDQGGFRWTFHPSGGLQLDWEIVAGGAFEHLGITFDHPPAETLAKRWVGRGPHRVWQNRMHGPRYGMFASLAKDAIPGRTWAEPEFTGCFASMHRLDLVGRAGTLEFLTDTPDLFARVLTPHFGSDPRRATAVLPEGDLSFLHVIPAIGTKFRSAAQLGPQSAPREIDGTQSGTIYLVFHPLGGDAIR